MHGETLKYMLIC